MAGPRYIVATIRNGQKFDAGFRCCIIGPHPGPDERVLGYFKNPEDAEYEANRLNAASLNSPATPERPGR